MKKQVTLTALALATAFSATTAFAGMTVAEKDGGKLQLSGKAFLGFTSNEATDAAGGTTKTIGGNVDRFYMQMKYKKGDWTARITTDVNNETPVGLKRNMNVFLKYAYLEGKFSDAVQLRIGLSHTPWIDYEQKLWGHRYVAKVTSDHYKFDNSADYGLGLKGKVAGGMVNYWVTATNGGGYGKPNQTGDLDLDTRITVKPIKELDVSLQYRSGYRGKKVAGGTNGTVMTGKSKEALTQLMVSYGTKSFRVGANTLSVKNVKNDPTIKNTASALWATGKFTKQFGAFAKLEQWKQTETPAAGTNKKDHTVVGIDFFAQKGVTLTAAYDSEKHTVGTTSTKKTEIGLYTLVKF